MTMPELKNCVGKTFIIRGLQHICIAAGADQLLLLELNAEGTPIQYIVAHSPSFYKGELVWAAGDYFIAQSHSAHVDGDPIICALQSAALALHAHKVYVAMARDDYGSRCVGIFAHRDAAVSALDHVIEQDAEACAIAADMGKSKLTYVEHCELDPYELGLENLYWLFEQTIK